MIANLEQVKAIFLEAVEMRAADERHAFLLTACAGNEDLLQQVEVLLQAHESGSLLDKGALAATSILDQPLTERPGAQIGPYRLLEQIGEGGMGAVYVAEQKQPVRRTVALKVIKPGMDTRDVIARFEAERQALAMMNHPNIARVLDAGATDAGRPYFVMELVKGTPITDFCDRQQLGTRERLRLFITLCQAVQHAHLKGLIHRDLKPGNVLVEVHDVTPVPKVIDFGVAKAIGQQLTERTLHTGFRQVVGTPLYMSPEQAGQSSIDVDTRSDVYSLGVLLYELLAGATPFDKETFSKVGYDEMRRIICEDEPPRPSRRLSTLEAQARSTVSGKRGVENHQLVRLLEGELDWIVMKALEKDRSRRYESASAFAADVQRYLNDQPVEACPPSAMYRLRKYIRRHRGLLTAAAALSLTVLIGSAVSVWQAVEATAARKQSDDNAKLAGERLVLADERLKLADQRLESETRALDEVRVQRQRARQAVDEMYSEVAEKWLQQQPKLTQVQRDFLEKALAFYQSFAQERASDPQLRYEAVLALQRVAGIQDKLGRLEAAEMAFVQSVKESGDLVRDYPDQAEFRVELSWGRVRLANIHFKKGRGQVADLDAVNEALHKLHATSLKDPKHRMKLANTLRLLCLALNYGNNRKPEAEAAAQSALKIWESLVAESPTEIDYRYGLADSYLTQGVLLMRDGLQNEKGMTALREAVERLSDLQKERPDEVRIRQSLADALGSLGVIQGWESRNDEKAETLRRSLQLQQGLAADFPDFVGYQDKLARELCSLADAELSQGLSPESAEHLRIALEIWERLADGNPEVVGNVSGIVRTLFDLARVLRKQGKFDEARQLLERAIHRAKQAVPDGKATDYFNFHVVRCSCELASTWIDLGDHAQAAQALADLTSTFEFLGDSRRTHDDDVTNDVLNGRVLVGRLLTTCAALAERDAILSPSERENAVHAYTEQANSWLKDATRVADVQAKAEINEWYELNPGQDNSRGWGWAFVPWGDEGLDWLERFQKPRWHWDSPLQRESKRLSQGLRFKATIREMIRRAPHDPTQYMVADWLTSAPEGYRDPEFSLQLARRALELQPESDDCIQSLGWALYRAGDAKDCIETLNKPKIGSASDFIRALAYWHLGNVIEARACFDRGTTWLPDYIKRVDEAQQRGVIYHPTPAMFKRLQAEAAEVLGLSANPDAPGEAQPDTPGTKTQ